MLIKLKNTTNQLAVDAITEFILSDTFPAYWRGLFASSMVDQTRAFDVFYTSHGQMFALPHSNFEAGEVPTQISITEISTLGLFQFYTLSLEGYDKTSMLWFIVPLVPATRYTRHGIVAFTQIPPESAKVAILSTVDDFIVVADSHRCSSAVMLTTIIDYTPT
jgi:hypothetical protein